MNKKTLPKELQSYIEAGMPRSLNYQEYRELIVKLHQEGKTTGPSEFDKYLDYSLLNEVRMKRLDKTVILNEALERILQSLSVHQTWILITESWCGDASQSVPIIAKMADSAGDKVNLRLIFRDQHPEIMKYYLTDGGNSIPKLIAVDDKQLELFHWGPRPAELQKKVMDYKYMPEPKKPYNEFQEEVHKWYADDKTVSVQSELMTLLSSSN
jgi:thiol-disulfide isomerase/thioredoxin